MAKTWPRRPPCFSPRSTIIIITAHICCSFMPWKQFFCSEIVERFKLSCNFCLIDTERQDNSIRLRSGVCVWRRMGSFSSRTLVRTQVLSTRIILVHIIHPKSQRPTSMLSLSRTLCCIIKWEKEEDNREPSCTSAWPLYSQRMDGNGWVCSRNSQKYSKTELRWEGGGGEGWQPLTQQKIAPLLGHSILSVQ